VNNADWDLDLGKVYQEYCVKLYAKMLAGSVIRFFIPGVKAFAYSELLKQKYSATFLYPTN